MTEIQSNPVEQPSGQVMENKTVSPSIVQETTEKLIPQSEVGKIAGASRKEGHEKGYEKGYQDALNKFQTQQAVSPTKPDEIANSQPPSTQNTNNNLAELVQRQVAEMLKKEREDYEKSVETKRQEEYFTNLSNQLIPKIEAAKQKHADFDESISKLHLDKIPVLLEWVNSVPNAGDVLYDLSKNPYKLAILNSMPAPELAIGQIHEIAQSLQNNQAAQEKSLPRNPISNIEPSNVGKSNETLTGQQVTEVARKKYRF